MSEVRKGRGERLMRGGRDSTPNRAIVLIQFREAGDAAEFKVMYNGKPYHDNAEVCLGFFPP